MGVSSVSGGQHRGGGVGAAPGYGGSDEPLLHTTASLPTLLFDKFSPRGVFPGASNWHPGAGKGRPRPRLDCSAGQPRARASTHWVSEMTGRSRLPTSPAAPGSNTRGGVRRGALTHHVQVEVLFHPGLGLLELLSQLHEVEGVKGIDDCRPVKASCSTEDRRCEPGSFSSSPSSHTSHPDPCKCLGSSGARLAQQQSREAPVPPAFEGKPRTQCPPGGCFLLRAAKSRRLAWGGRAHGLRPAPDRGHLCLPAGAVSAPVGHPPLPWDAEVGVGWPWADTVLANVPVLWLFAGILYVILRKKL